MDAFDLLVIGGGINGLGVAVDAAGRGLSTLLVERNDIGGGTTAASSRLIHGGLRYLEYGEFSLVSESLRERAILARRFPGRVRPLELLVPTYRDLGRPGWQLAAGLRLYGLLGRDALFPPPRYLGVHEARDREPGLAPEGLLGGWLYTDGQLEFPERLCVELARDAVKLGATLLNHWELVKLRHLGKDGVMAQLRDRLGGEEREVQARCVVNAGGPWVDVINGCFEHPPPRLMGGSWGLHLVLPRKAAGPKGSLYSEARQDRRPYFVLAWDERVLVGTTDVPLTAEAHLDTLKAEPWEESYLLDELNALYPHAGYAPDEVEWRTLGIRPLPRSDRAAAAVTRRHFLVDHRRDGLDGVASLVGGKLTTFRSLAEEAVDWSAAFLKRRDAVCRTREPAVSSMTPGNSRRERIYGPALREIEERERRNPDQRASLAPGCPASLAEARHAVECEFARTPDDLILRRLMLLPPRQEWLDAARRVLDGTPPVG